MNTLDLGHQWLVKLSRALPHSSIRIRTRLAWRLAALAVQSDEALRNLDDAELMQFIGGSPKIVEMRQQYFRYLDSVSAAVARDIRNEAQSDSTKSQCREPVSSGRLRIRPAKKS